MSGNTQMLEETLQRLEEILKEAVVLAVELDVSEERISAFLRTCHEIYTSPRVDAMEGIAAGQMRMCEN